MTPDLILTSCIGISIIIIALGIAVSLVVKAKRTPVRPTHEIDEDVAKTLETSLAEIRTTQFGRTMAPIPRQVPQRFNKG